MKLERKISRFGFINIDKPSGVSSSFIVNKIKYLTGVPCGHMGTLDPLASGVLPVGIGNATRLFDYFLQKQKRYIAEFTFGEFSDTLDSTGEVQKGGRIPTEEEIRSVLGELIGDVDQMPPKYSAKSVGGRRGYELARAGVEFTLQPKRVHIENVELLGRGSTENSYSFAIDCGAGTYIRSIARDMAEKLQTNALMSGLIREKSGLFTLDKAVKFENITLEDIENNLIKTEDVLPFEEVYLTTKDKVFCGLDKKVELPDGTYKIYSDGEFYGLGEVKDGRLKTTVKLC